MNKRNIERKRIEQISPTISTGDQIQGNELFMVSARDTNSANGYSTKKMGIQALKDYVLSGISGGSSNNVNCGNPIFFDSQESDNYVWNPVYEANSTEFTKIATHDCVVIPFMIDRNFYTANNLADADHTIPLWRIYEEVRIDDLLINPVALALAHNNAGDTGFYLKKGQKLNVKLTQFAIDKLGVTGNNLNRLSYQFLPITNGGTFVDTDKMKALMRDYPEQYVDSDGNWKYNNATYQDGVPFSFPFSAHVAYYNLTPPTYVDPTQSGENREQNKYAPKIDGKYVQSIWQTYDGQGQRIDINLKANQTLEIYSNSTNASLYFDIRSFACVPIMDNPSYASYEDLNVQLIDNHDSNVIDLEVTQSPENSTITYFVSSSYETSNASWQSLLDNRATITFSSQTDRDKKYVFFKVSQNGSDSIYMMQLMQSYYATQDADAAYDIKTVNLGYAGYQSSSTGNNTFPEEYKNSAKTYLLNQLPSLQSDGYTEIYNNVNADWDGIGVVQRTNADNFMTRAVYQRTNTSINFNWVCKVRRLQTSSGAYTYLHSIILQLSYFGD